ncbi:hypothetical protein CWE09_05795 [Aliidiomarina minuta]|uniref:ABC transporter domain-containing protein n=1 Tax=Aliidiomarina minuta TaxID=880057 RepID=A0A432W7Z3_9GAMM|nr:ABC transporter ATP-binding protein [Aliidiomarina minuta]RUO26227.1 hypothetical protein CWE09_05795 [Aliidiomarina minuta]
MSEKLICQQLSVGYPRRPQVLQDIELAFEAGQVTCILGENGSGKSTLLKTLAGLMPPLSGFIHWRDQDLVNLGRRQRARDWGYLAQQGRPEWSMPVHEIVRLGTYARPDWSKQEAEEAHTWAMQETHCEGLANRPVLELSAGEQQRVLIARLLASRPQVILADEPTAGLDPRHQLEVMGLLQEQARQGALVITVMHDLALAASHSDQAVMLHQGGVFAAGDSREIIQPQNLRAVFGIG